MDPDPDPGAQKHVDPDPDLQHCEKGCVAKLPELYEMFSKLSKIDEFLSKCKHRFLKFINLKFARVIQIFMSSRSEMAYQAKKYRIWIHNTAGN